jgi:uncharacterized membrane protein YccC
MKEIYVTQQSKEEVEAQIDILNKTRTYFDVSKLDTYEQKHHIRFTSIIIDQLKELQQQLKQLEDETNNQQNNSQARR